MKIGLTRRLVLPEQRRPGLFGAYWRTDWDNRFSDVAENRIVIESAAGPLFFFKQGDSKEYLGPPGERLTRNDDGTAVRRRADLDRGILLRKGAARFL